MTVETYKYGELGFAIDPESDTKQRTVILLGLQTVKCNPRPVVIYVTGGKVNESYAGLEDLKNFCAENKLVFLCPEATDCDGLLETYEYIKANYLELNVVKEDIRVKADAEHMAAAEEFAEYLSDEFDIETEVEEF